jgi:hypothetical protein
MATRWRRPWRAHLARTCHPGVQAHLVQEFGGAVTAQITVGFMQAREFVDAVADGLTRIERGVRILEDELDTAGAT